MSDSRDLELLIHGHVPIITIETQEESRALNLIIKASRREFLPTFKWTVTDGLQRLDLNLDPQRHVSDPQDGLKHIKSSALQGIYILLDFDPYLQDPINIRLLKEIAMMFDGNKGKLILLSHQLKLPANLQSLACRFSLDLPSPEVLEKMIRDEAQIWQASGNQRVRTDRETLDRLIQNLSGLTHRDSKRLIRNAIIDDGAITESDLPEVMQAKYRLLNKDDILSFEFETAHFSDLGGMEKLKGWLKQRESIFTQKTSSVLDTPKGILLLGVQGCGKSLAAKTVAGIWGIPLLRLDFGRLYDKYVGETEKNLRQALKTAEVMSPCVLWIDELEKGIASGNDDQGTSRRLLGSLLTWMSEKSIRVFIVATANQIEALPPELIRKGRLDEIFFVDLPKNTGREHIFKIHFEKREITYSQIDLPQIAAASDGFSGSEIEQVVVSALYACHGTSISLNTDIILQEIKNTRPLSVVMAEQIQDLRQWASERTVPVD
ncbi:MAG TPA: AAA family ATPase [Gammaproteobacteria bacterium]|nr:AAA family ATPase [Gammaproteobacteria bacterium]